MPQCLTEPTPTSGEEPSVRPQVGSDPLVDLAAPFDHCHQNNSYFIKDFIDDPPPTEARFSKIPHAGQRRGDSRFERIFRKLVQPPDNPLLRRPVQPGEVPLCPWG